MPQETKTSEYWDSVHRALRTQFIEYQERTKASNLAHEKWRDSMEALNEVPQYTPQAELFATEAQYYIIPIMVTLFVGILILGIVLVLDSRQAEKSKKRRSNSILNYRDDED